MPRYHRRGRSPVEVVEADEPSNGATARLLVAASMFALFGRRRSCSRDLANRFLWEDPDVAATWPAPVLIKESTNDSVRRPRLSIVVLAAGSSSVLQTVPRRWQCLLVAIGSSQVTADLELLTVGVAATGSAFI